MEPWEDELLWDDDFSDEEEDTEKQIEEALAEERTLELESELEQDEHPKDYAAELEDEEEEAAPPVENGSNEKFGQRLCGGWRKQPGRNRIF